MKTIFIKIEVIFFALLLAMSFSTASFSQNVLYNGDFEVPHPDDVTMPDNWWIEYCNTPDYTSFGIDDQVKHSGNYSFKISTIAGKTSNDCVIMPSNAPETLHPGGLYKVSYWVKTEGTGVYNVCINALWANDQIAEPLVGTTDWTYREAILTYGADWYLSESEEFKNTHFLSLWFNADSCSEAGSAWYDDISVEYLGTPPTSPEDLSLIADYEDGQVILNWGAATETENPIAYYLIKRVKKGAEAPNACTNPSFEDPNESFTFPSDWFTFFWSSADQQSWAEGVARTGDFSVTISSELGGHSFISKGLFPPEGTRGFDVYMKAYVKTENVVGGSGAFIDFQSWGGTKTGVYGTNDWTACDAVMENVIPGIPCAVMFGNYYDGSGGDLPDTKTSGQAWYDDVSIVVLDSVGQATGLSFTDTDVIEGEIYHYTVRAVDNRGLLGDAQLVTVEMVETAVEDPVALAPKKTELIGNYPNPFNPSTTIMFSLAKQSDVNISIYNMLGQKVAEVVNKNFQAGAHKVQWKAGSEISSGVYFYDLRAGDFAQVKKMILMR